MPDGWFESATQPLKLVQNVGLQTAVLLPMGGNNKLGVTETNLAATLAVPILYNQAPLLITPGFSFDFFQGPISVPPVNADLPPTTYSAYIDVAWRPRILPSVTPWLSADIGVRTGIYTDFHAVNDHSIRVLGRGLAIATVTERVQLVFGVVYLDRVLVKILPAGGVIWTPNPDARYEIFFPSPKLARRWTTVRTTDLWFYLAGEYGGGSWTVRRASGADDQVDYNDIRVSLGMESFAQNGLHGIFEVGYVFDRAGLSQRRPEPILSERHDHVSRWAELLARSSPPKPDFSCGWGQLISWLGNRSALAVHSASCAIRLRCDFLRCDLAPCRSAGSALV